MGSSFAFLTRHDDPQWSDFVYWVVMGLIYAESADISSQENLSDLPVINLFGEEFTEMFVDIISAVGSYAEIYNNTLEPLIPRSGGNLLNDLNSPQQFPVHI